MEKKELMYEGKAKEIFATDNEDVILMHYKDDATAGNGVKHDQFAGKGVLNHTISGIIFDMLEEAGIKTHMIEKLNDTDDLVKKVIHSPSEMDKRVIVFPNSALKANDKKINYYNLIKSRKYADLNKAVLRIYPKINLDKIFRIIDSVESLDIDRKLFYKGILFARYEMILSPAYEALIKREDRMASAIADYEIVSSVEDY